MDEKDKLYRAMDIAVQTAIEAYATSLSTQLSEMEVEPGLLASERHIHTGLLLAGRTTLALRVQLDFDDNPDVLRALLAHSLSTHRRPE